MSQEVVQIGDCTLYCGDCRAIVPGLTQPIHALVSDPPYGIAFNYTKTRQRGRDTALRGMGRSVHTPASRWTRSVTQDTQPFDPVPWLAYPQVILWGANHYASRLPDSGAWLIWDKRDGRTSDDMSDCELAWTNLGQAARVWRQLWRGMVRAGEDNLTHGPKTHPAQKPIELLLWCVQKTTGLVCDPYAGSFTTGVACVRLGRQFIGVEIEREYFDIACQRITDAYKQPPLFPHTPVAAPQQLTLTGGAS